MSCGNLANTGTPLAGIVTLAAFCVAAGLLLLFIARRRRRDGVATFVVLALLVGVLVGGAHTRADAATGTCPGGVTTTPAPTQTEVVAPGGGVEHSFTIVQTSVMTGIAPGLPARPIYGVVTNTGGENLFVTTITVSISSVTKATAAVAGTCDATDFLLSDVAMPVGVVVSPGDSTGFSGASIGFNDKSVDQDACQNATIHLLYRAS